MTNYFLAGTAALGVAAQTHAAPIQSGSRPFDLKAIAASVDGEYLSYSSGFGSRRIVNATSKTDFGATDLTLGISQGERKAEGESHNAVRGSATLVHNWSSRVSTRTTARLSTNSPVFASRELAQDISYALPSGTVATIGGRYSRYYGGRDALSWSVGAAQYFRDGFISYRLTAYDIDRIGNSVGHVVSAKLSDPYGSTQLWVGHSNGAAIDSDDLLISDKGKFTEVTLRRTQKVKGGLAFTAGVKQNWYRTDLAKFNGTGFHLGLAYLPAGRSN